MPAIGSVWGAGTWADDCWADGAWGDAGEAVVAPPVSSGFPGMAQALARLAQQRRPIEVQHRGKGGLRYGGQARVQVELAPVSSMVHAGFGALQSMTGAANVRQDNQIVVAARRAARRAALLFG